MATLSEAALAQFNQSAEPGGSTKPHRRVSISTFRSSHSRDPPQQPLPRQPPLPLRGIAASPLRSSAVSNHSSPMVRRDSSLLTKRFSFGGWQPGGRTSFSGLTLPQVPAQKTENTYRTEPEKSRRFKTSAVQKLLQTTLEHSLEGTCYDPASNSHLGQLLTNMLRGKVKEICPPRYKLVCQVVIGQKGKQSVLVASRCLWDDKLDSFAVAEFQNNSLFALAIVHAIYSE